MAKVNKGLVAALTSVVLVYGGMRYLQNNKSSLKNISLSIIGDVREYLSDKRKKLIEEVSVESNSFESNKEEPEYVSSNKKSSADMASVVKEGVDTYKDTLSQQERRDENNAQHLFETTEELKNKLKYQYHTYTYDTVYNIFTEAEKDLSEAKYYLNSDDYSRSSQYSEKALNKFSRIEKIIIDNDEYWNSLEEKHKQLDLKICHGVYVLHGDEDNKLHDKVLDLYHDAQNILRGGTWLEGGLASRKNLELADKKMDEAFRIMEELCK